MYYVRHGGRDRYKLIAGLAVFISYVGRRGPMLRHVGVDRGGGNQVCYRCTGSRMYFPPDGRRESFARIDMPRENTTGFVPKTIEMDGRVYRYAVWVPEDYDPDRKWPVILFLHGKGECGDDGEFHTTVGLGREIRKMPERFPALVVMPQIPVGEWWKGSMQTLALGALDATLNEYSADRDRIVLTGLSLGGFGTWSLGAKRTDLFCGLVPICGGGDPADAGKLARLPIWCFHGDADAVVAVSRSREMVEAVRAAGGEVKYSELVGVEHNSWTPAYSDPEVIAWMLARHR